MFLLLHPPTSHPFSQQRPVWPSDKMQGRSWRFLVKKISQWLLVTFEIKIKLCTLAWAWKGTARLPTPFLATLPFAYHGLAKRNIFLVSRMTWELLYLWVLHFLLPRTSKNHLLPWLTPQFPPSLLFLSNRHVHQVLSHTTVYFLFSLTHPPPTMEALWAVAMSASVTIISLLSGTWHATLVDSKDGWMNGLIWSCFGSAGVTVGKTHAILHHRVFCGVAKTESRSLETTLWASRLGFRGKWA